MTRIDHTGHGHPLTRAARKACRDSVIRVGTRVMVHLDDADRDFAGTVLEIEPFGTTIRYYVQLDNRLCVFSPTLRTRKA